MPKRAVSPELVDLTSSPKRQLVDASSHAAVPEERQCVRAASSSHRWPDSPFHLMRVRGLPTWANEGSLGIKLSEVVAGPMRTVLISNYVSGVAGSEILARGGQVVSARACKTRCDPCATMY